MVYDVGDKRSFDYAVRCVRLLITKQASDFEMNHNGSVDCKAVLLLGNKTDMVVSKKQLHLVFFSKVDDV